MYSGYAQGCLGLVEVTNEQWTETDTGSFTEGYSNGN